MIYHWSLHTTGLAAGVFLGLIGLLGLYPPINFRAFAQRFPRSQIAGIILLTIDAVWSFWLLWTMEMGEFTGFRKPLLILLPVGYFLVLRFVDEFLAVRALGILFLLSAEPLIDAAFFRYEASRLVLTVFAYLLVAAGILWVTMPYTLRDEINWSARNNTRWRCVHGLLLAYGAALVTLAVMVY
jgi:hypothetical protein